MITSRRSLLLGLTTLIAAPAIVRASSLMPVKPLPVETPLPFGLAPIQFDFPDSAPFVAGGPIIAGMPVYLDSDGNAQMLGWSGQKIFGISAVTCSRGATGMAITLTPRTAALSASDT